MTCVFGRMYECIVSCRFLLFDWRRAVVNAGPVTLKAVRNVGNGASQAACEKVPVRSFCVPIGNIEDCGENAKDTRRPRLPLHLLDWIYREMNKDDIT